MTLLTPGHKTDPVLMETYSCLVMLHKMIARHADLHEDLVKMWSLTRGKAKRQLGPFSKVAKALLNIGWLWVDMWH
eukprot:1466930-Karenia_brevis.AAC.1